MARVEKVVGPFFGVAVLFAVLSGIQARSRSRRRASRWHRLRWPWYWTITRRRCLVNKGDVGRIVDDRQAGQWSMVNGQWSMIDCPLPRPSGQRNPASRILDTQPLSSFFCNFNSLLFFFPSASFSLPRTERNGHPPGGVIVK